MAAELTWPQLREWMAFYQMDPWGGERADLQAAIIASTMANLWRQKGKPFQVGDFMPTFGEKRRQTQEEMSIILMAAAKAAQAAKR